MKYKIQLKVTYLLYNNKRGRVSKRATLYRFIEYDSIRYSKTVFKQQYFKVCINIYAKYVPKVYRMIIKTGFILSFYKNKILARFPITNKQLLLSCVTLKIENFGR